MPYPWQIKQWRELQDAVIQQRLPHALLLAGANGTGLHRFASELASSLLCEHAREDGAACGQCGACVLLNADNHPDMRRLSPQDADQGDETRQQTEPDMQRSYPQASGGQIKVESIRELIGFFHLSTQYGRHKIAIIEPAEAMNRSAANALLKTLEEPPPLSLLILITYQQAKLPITIRSRCHKMLFNAAERSVSFDWLDERLNAPEITAELLALTDQAPLRALELSETDILERRREVMDDLRELRMFNADPVYIAEKWQRFDTAEVLRWLLAMFSKMARVVCSPDMKIIDNARINKDLHHLSNGLHLQQVISCYDLALKNYHLITGTTNLNKQGLLEEIIIHWQFLGNNG